MNTTTEELLALTTAQQPTITTRQCSRSWLAWLSNDPIDTESGTTEAEAIGKLHLLHQEILGIVQRQES